MKFYRHHIGIQHLECQEICKLIEFQPRRGALGSLHHPFRFNQCEGIQTIKPTLCKHFKCTANGWRQHVEKECILYYEYKITNVDHDARIHLRLVAACTELSLCRYSRKISRLAMLCASKKPDLEAWLWEHQKATQSRYCSERRRKKPSWSVLTS